ncbi:MAG TPA: DNA-formamidopyrimidine glycosylase family protein, partial [Fimbriimonas sp.]|nr:DNA-formamidopyrimidine glycosylase family protein [Fimbriimonas sp.]
MPELPEVETVRRTLERVLVGRKITDCEFVEDSIVFKGHQPDLFYSAVKGATVVAARRHGKYFWLELDTKPWLFAHLGMAGWLREMGAHTIRLREHGNAPMEDATGRAKFLKMMLQSDEGRQVVLTDGRRLARIWALNSPSEDRAISLLGPDCFASPLSGEDIAAAVGKRSAPIKALLLDQSLFAGVGNWIADEVLYQAGIK